MLLYSIRTLVHLEHKFVKHIFTSKNYQMYYRKCKHALHISCISTLSTLIFFFWLLSLKVFAWWDIFFTCCYIFDRYVVGDLQQAFNTLLKAAGATAEKHVITVNPYGDVAYTVTEAESVCIFNLCALAEIGNTKSNLIAVSNRERNLILLWVTYKQSVSLMSVHICFVNNEIEYTLYSIYIAFCLPKKWGMINYEHGYYNAYKHNLPPTQTSTVPWLCITDVGAVTKYLWPGQ